jgi:aminoglycoside phosphotransferase (APT) family kinase protein
LCAIFARPYLVIDYIDGEPVFDPPELTSYVTQMAAELVKIHSVTDLASLAFLPRQGSGFGARPAALDDEMHEGRIRDALEARWPLAQTNADTLLHGDYWPGNILWQDGTLAAVIDWEDARVGDPLADLGNCRLELLWAFGPDAMHDFTAHYQSLTTVAPGNLPYWDLCAALHPCGRLSEWGLDAATEQRMRAQHASFVEQALDALAAR